MLEPLQLQREVEASDMAAVVGFIDEAIQNAENEKHYTKLEKEFQNDVSQKIVCDVKI